MDSESAEKLVSGLSRALFREAVQLVLTKRFGLRVANSDGTGDGGSDWRVFTDAGDSTTLAIQDTTQKDGWKAKAINDARKAVRELGATRFFYITSVGREDSSLRQLESVIISELKIPATCIGAKQLGSFLVDPELLGSFLSLIGVSQAAPLATRPDRREILLHSYIVFGQDRATLRESIFDDTIVMAIRASDSSLSRDEVINASIEMLGCGAARTDTIARRIDSLLTRGVITKSEKKLLLTTHTSNQLIAAERIYEQELTEVCERQTVLLRNNFGVDWNPSDARTVTLLIARSFIHEQLCIAKAAKITLPQHGLIEGLGDPLQELRDFLRNHGLQGARLVTAMSQLVDDARDSDLIKKLARSAIFVAIERANPIIVAKALGAATWTDVTVMIDASVAIPYLCARFYAPTGGKFSNSAAEILTSLRSLGAKTAISYFHLEECAAHLLRALKFEAANDFAADLEHSTNGFVSHYYQLRSMGGSVPPSLSDYLQHFSEAIRFPQEDKYGWTKSIVSDLRPLLRGYEIQLENLPIAQATYRRDIETEYSHWLKQLKKKKSSKLLEDDVRTVSAMRQLIVEEGRSFLFLTWDRSLIKVGNSVPNCGWILHPPEAIDFIQWMLPISHTKFCALSHLLASSRERPMEIGARIVERILGFAADRMQEWQFKEEIKRFKNELLDRVDLTQPNYGSWVDSQTDGFLEKQGINIATDRDMSAPTLEPLGP